MTSKRTASDVLLYAEMIGPSVLRLKDGALLTGFLVSGPDLESALPGPWAAMSQAIHRALQELDAGWTVHVETARVPRSDYARGDFSDPTCQLIEDERKERCLYFETRQWIFLTYAPRWARSSAGSQLKSWLDERPCSSPAEDLVRQRREFEAKVETFEHALASCLEIVRLRHDAANDELLQAIHYCVSGHFQPVRLPDVPVCLDVLLAEGWIQGQPLLLGERLVGAVTLRGYPGDSFPGCLQALQALPFAFRWSNRFIVKDYQESEALLKKEQRRWQQKTRSFVSQLLRSGGRLDHHAVERANELDSALGDLNAGAVAYGHHSSVFLVSADTAEDVESRCAMLSARIRETGFVPHIETYNALEAFVGSLPGHRRQNVRRPVIHTLNFADLLPVSREWGGSPTCPSPHFPEQDPALLQTVSASGARFFLNLHVGDVGHTLVLGPTGSGKSTLLALLAAQFFRYEHAQVFAFDKGRSLYPLCAAHESGAHIDFGESTPELCPLRDLDRADKRTWAVEWIEGLLLLQGVRMDAPKRRRLIEAVETFALSEGGGSLCDFVTTLQDDALRTALAYYAGEGPGARLLDGTTTALPSRDLVVFEIEELMNMGPKIVNATLLYLFWELERRLDGRPTLLILDEAWLALNNPLFAEKLREWLKVLRKANCAVVMATQSLSDVVDSPIRDAVLESCPTRLLLPNPEAESVAMKRLYRDYLRLDDQETAIVAGAQKKRHYYYVSPAGRRLFDLQLGPVSLAFLGVNGKKELARVRELRREDPTRWPGRWLLERGLPEEADRWIACKRPEGNEDHEPPTAEYETHPHAMAMAEMDLWDGPTRPFPAE